MEQGIEIRESQEIPVLDRGYVRFVESWGSDSSIIEAARMSTQKGFQGWGPRYKCECRTYTIEEYTPWCLDDCKEVVVQIEGDEKLLRYLYTHRHMTPFEMAGLIIEVQAPIFVFREWHRHRTQSYNEMSGRYTELPDLYYLPSIERLMVGKQSQTNKQASAEGFDAETAVDLMAGIAHATRDARDMYESLLKRGVSRELARLVLPVNQYSRMRASANLRNWLGFLELRQAEGSQWEIRQYADAVATLVEQHFPRTYALYKESNAG